MEEDFNTLKKYNSKIAFERVDLECAAACWAIDKKRRLISHDMKFRFVNSKKTCEELRLFWLSRNIDHETYAKVPKKMQSWMNFCQHSLG